MDRKIVVVAGATGRLGGLIARALVKNEGVTVRAPIRPGNAQKAADLAKLGVEIIEAAIDGSGDKAALDKIMQGAFSVVSALQGGDDVLVTGSDFAFHVDHSLDRDIRIVVLPMAVFCVRR